MLPHAHAISPPLFCRATALEFKGIWSDPVTEFRNPDSSYQYWESFLFYSVYFKSD